MANDSQIIATNIQQNTTNSQYSLCQELSECYCFPASSRVTALTYIS